MILPEKSKALRLIIDLVNRGEHGGAVTTANGLKDILGVPVRQRVEAVTRNEGFYQVALRDKLSGVDEVLAFGPEDGSAYKWGRGEWVPLPPSHPLADLAKIQEKRTEVEGLRACLLPYVQKINW